VNEFPDAYEEIVLVAMERDKRIKAAKKKALREYRKWKETENKLEESERVVEQGDDIILKEENLFEFIHKNKDIVSEERVLDTNQYLQAKKYLIRQ
jgi:hypothetical protein